jgi:hypothetical protein
MASFFVYQQKFITWANIRMIIFNHYEKNNPQSNLNDYNVLFFGTKTQNRENYL